MKYYIILIKAEGLIKLNNPIRIIFLAFFDYWVLKNPTGIKPRMNAKRVKNG